ncbi:chromobox protein homolog 3-like [Episyrphus balteatus]|uniref:chromobox protein homolog 3-like n=1 Tax=Episyrphus balteatus TaxID=286459 RepID=UPI0024867C61|nr:chromobox protein homolog 3-like [Episyrphus balteatus]
MVKVKSVGFSVEKIVDKRISTEGKIEYFIKWRGYPNSDNTWEPEEHCNCPQLIQKFEESRAKAKKRGDKKPKIEEITKPRGYDRGLTVEEILGATDVTGDVSYLIKWSGCNEYDLVAGSEVRERDPLAVLEFYEKRSPFQRWIENRSKGIPEELKTNALQYSNSNVDTTMEDAPALDGTEIPSLELDLQ